jgi:hypothetical protein
MEADMRKYVVRSGLVGAFCGALLLVAGLPAAAVPDRSGYSAVTAAPAEARLLEITSTADALLSPASATPGPATFRSTTTDPASGWVGLARLNEGVTVEQFHAILLRLTAPDSDEVVAGSRELNAAAKLLGGAIIHPGQPGTFTQTLSSGRYVLFDYMHIADARPRINPLTVSGTWSGREPVPTATVVTLTVPGVGPRYEVTGTLRAGQPIRFVNRMPGQINEAVFFPIADDVDEADLAAYFAQFEDDSNAFPPNPPFSLASGLGCLPVSGGKSSVFQVPLQTGRHVLVTLNKDATDGVRLAKKGQFMIVQVR